MSRSDQTQSDAEILSAIMDAAVDAMVVSDELGRIIRANAAAHRLFGYQLDDLLGRNVAVLMPEDMASEHHDFMTSYLDTGEAEIIGRGREVIGKKKCGESFPLHLSIGEAKAGGTRRFVAIMHDLKNRRAATEALARAQRLDAIGQMTGGVAHDFNNFLTVIIGNLELLEMRIEDQRSREILFQVLETTEMATGLISRLMLFARQGTLNIETADISLACRNLMNILRRTLGPDIQVTTRFNRNVPEVMLDLIHFQSAVMNLILNAKDAMPDGGELRISTEEVQIDDSYMSEEAAVPPGSYVCLTISDTGIGMNRETSERLFEPFFTTKKSRDGTGLGLASVYGFIRQLGGNITVSSRQGDGTSFALYFPVADNGAAVGKPVVEKTGEPAAGNGELVLVVEDTAKVRDITVTRIKALGYSVAAAVSADEAWDMIESGLKPVLVFSDLVMPGRLNGYELAERISREHPEITILLTSGYASEVAAVRQERDSRYPLLHKPYHQRDLAARLKALIN